MIIVLMRIMSPFVSENIAFVYMDDIPIASPDRSQHLERLDTVLKLVNQQNIS
jgi:hypothetical protein